MKKIRHTALHRACEELTINNPHFRRFYIGTSEAYGYAMSVYDKKDLHSHFTVVPDGRIICWNHGETPLRDVHPFTTKAECKKIIHEAMRLTDKMIDMERDLAREANQRRLL